MPELPTGTVTFLFTDIEGSTNLARTLGARWPHVLGEHHGILRAAIREHGGVELRTDGDAFFAVFRSAVDAVAATAEAQKLMAKHPWPEESPVCVRMGMHTGEGQRGGDDYVGLDVHRAARIAAAGHGQQVLLSEATRVLVAEALPEAVTLKDLGRHRLKDFDDPQPIHQLVIEGLPYEFPALKTLDVPTNLPPEITSFVGREREIHEITELVRASALVTLTGPGGTGKTRLARRVAATLLSEFPDGAYFVDLSPIADAELVPSEIARVLGLKEDPGHHVLETLTEQLRTRQLLLALDNFEQVREAATTVEAIMAADAKVHTLVTSRVPLSLYGEHDFRVPPLVLPDPEASPPLLKGNEAVALFAERAGAANSDFTLTDDNVAAIAEICVRLDGLPLAIELAASRARLLTPRAILGRLVERLPLLEGGPRNAPERQRTLRAAIDWSVNLLGLAERRLLARLSVFAGGCTIDAADAVCNPHGELEVATFEGVELLVDHSLLRQTEKAGAEPRLAMLETIREYAGEILAAEGEAQALAERYARYFLTVAEEAEPHFDAEDQTIWLDRIEREHDNFRAALRWAVDAGETEVAQGIAAALWRFWYQRGHLRESADWLAAAVDLPGPRDAVRARAHIAAGGIAYWRGEFDSVRRHYEEALAISREVGDRRGEMDGLYNVGFVPMVTGDHVAAVPFWQQSQAIARELGDRTMMAKSVQNVGYTLMLMSEPAGALPLLEEARAIWLELKNRTELAESTGVIGHIHRTAGNLEEAVRFYREALEIFHEAGNLPSIAGMLDGLAAVASTRGRHEAALRLTGAAAALKERIGGGIPMAAVIFEDVTPAAGAAIGKDAADAELARGRSMTVDEAVAYALGDLEI
jgi:predicted ATPase/class 3 adenylate cyclase